MQLPWILVAVRTRMLTSHIIDFSVNAEQISTKLERKHVLNVLYQIRVFLTNPSTKIVTLIV